MRILLPLGCEVKDTAQILEQQCAADVAVAVSRVCVEAKTGMLIAMFMTFGKWTGAVQPVATWFTSVRSERVRDLRDQASIGDELLIVS